MTNLLAAVTVALVTNVTESVPVLNGSSIYYGSEPVIIDQSFHYQWGDPNTKTVTTTVTEVITATFDLDGETVTTKREREVSSTVKTYRKKIEWEEVGTPRRDGYINLVAPDFKWAADIPITLNGNGEIE